MLSIRHDILQEFRRMSLTDARVTVALARLDRRHLECQRDRRSLAELRACDYQETETHPGSLCFHRQDGNVGKLKICE